MGQYGKNAEGDLPEWFASTLGSEGSKVGSKRHYPEEFIKLWRVEVLCDQGMPRVDAIR